MHSHPNYVALSFAGSGKTKFTSSDGKAIEAPAKAGRVTWLDAEIHASEYTGEGETRVWLVELKGRQSQAVTATRPPNTASKDIVKGHRSSGALSC